MELAMNTTELAAQLADQHELTKTLAKQIVDDVLAAIVDAAQSGDEVSLAGFGKFSVKIRAARKGRNPATGEAIKIAASKRLAFSPAKSVRDAMNSPKKAKKKK